MIGKYVVSCKLIMNLTFYFFIIKNVSNKR